LSDLANLTAAPGADVLPGHVLSPAGLAEFGIIEKEFSREHLAQAADAGADQPKAIADRLLSLAMADVRAGEFNWGRLGFDAKCASGEALPFLLWVVLQIKDSKVTREQAKALITQENQYTVRRAVLECLGFDFTSPKPNAAVANESKQTAAAAESTGEKSANTSEKNAA
jgi:hypothetical protein